MCDYKYISGGNRKHITVVEPDDILMALHKKEFQLLCVDSEGCQVSWLQVPTEHRSFFVAHYYGGGRNTHPVL